MWAAWLADVSSAQPTRGDSYSWVLFMSIKYTLSLFVAQAALITHVFIVVVNNFFCRFNQDALALPPSLAAFSPSERGTVVYTGYAVEKEIIFYCLYKKQVLQHPLSAFIAMTVYLMYSLHTLILARYCHWFCVCLCFTGFEDDLSCWLGALSRSLLDWKTDRCWVKPLVCCCTLNHDVYVSYVVIYQWCFVFQSASWSWFIRPAGVFRISRLTVTRFTCAASAGLDLSSSPLLIMSSYCGLYTDYNADTTLMLEFDPLTPRILDCTSYSAVTVSFSV